MLTALKTRLAILLNKFRRRNGPALRDQIAQVLMRMCALQLERGQFRELAPTPGATGPMVISGGAITTVTYRVFDRNADRVDKGIKNEPWRAFAFVTMRLSLESDPHFEVLIGGPPEAVAIEAETVHKAPGLALVKALSEYFPLLPKAFEGIAYKPPEVG